MDGLVEKRTTCSEDSRRSTALAVILILRDRTKAIRNAWTRIAVGGGETMERFAQAPDLGTIESS